MLGKYAEKICTPGYFALHMFNHVYCKHQIPHRLPSSKMLDYEIAYLSNRFADVEN